MAWVSAPDLVSALSIILDTASPRAAPVRRRAPCPIQKNGALPLSLYSTEALGVANRNTGRRNAPSALLHTDAFPQPCRSDLEKPPSISVERRVCVNAKSIRSFGSGNGRAKHNHSLPNYVLFLCFRLLPDSKETANSLAKKRRNFTRRFSSGNEGLRISRQLRDTGNDTFTNASITRTRIGLCQTCGNQ